MNMTSVKIGGETLPPNIVRLMENLLLPYCPHIEEIREMLRDPSNQLLKPFLAKYGLPELSSHLAFCAGVSKNLGDWQYELNEELAQLGFPRTLVEKVFFRIDEQGCNRL